MQAVIQQPGFRPSRVTSGDRLGLTLFFAAVLHAVVILGVSFNLTDLLSPEEPVHRLEITLVTKRSETPPDDPDYLAQADHEGAGNVEEQVRPTAPAAGPTVVSQSPQGTTPEQRTATSRPEPPQPEQRQLLTQEQAPAKVKTRVEKKSKPAPKPLTATELINRSMEIASLDAEIKQRQQAYADRPRVKYISASTREYKYATYMEAWRAKVERIGRLNYPEEAKRQKLSGSLLLDVALNADGTVKKINLRRSSGNKILDDAAIRIVNLASPFAPFPDNIRNETDVLHIQRTWIFKSGNQLVAK